MTIKRKNKIAELSYEEVESPTEGKIVLVPDAEYDESVLNQITEENIQEFYNTYHKNMKKMAEEYGKTAVQKKYLMHLG